jgi:hypothetical protein
MLCAPTFATARGVGPAENEHEAATVTPVLEIETGKTMTVRVTFKNTTQKAIRYFGGVEVHPDENSPGLLTMSLCENGGRIYRSTTDGRPEIIASNVYVLEPGKSVDVQFRIPGDYGSLKPGRYDVRITYDIKENDGYVKEFGITPMSINKSILSLDVIEARTR